MKYNNKQSLKEAIRHGLYQAGVYRLLDVVRHLKGYETSHLSQNSRTKRFEKIYDADVWARDKHQDAKSGLGSEIENTQNVQLELPRLLKDLSINSLVDVGCGDWTWMSQIELPCDYLGLDIVQNVVQANKTTYGKLGINFQQLDAVDEPLPDCNAILCREVILHMNFIDAIKLIRNIKKHSEFLIATTDTALWFNSNIPTGDYRMLNLQRIPFNFPKPEIVIWDDALVAGRQLAIWKTSSLP